MVVLRHKILAKFQALAVVAYSLFICLCLLWNNAGCQFLKCTIKMSSQLELFHDVSVGAIEVFSMSNINLCLRGLF